MIRTGEAKMNTNSFKIEKSARIDRLINALYEKMPEIESARGILVNITASPDIALEEVDIASSMIKNEAHPDAQVIWGATFDKNLEDEIKVTVIATGFESPKKSSAPDAAPKTVVVEDRVPQSVIEEEENVTVFRNEYAEGSGDSENVGDGISDSDFDDILSLLKKN